jgi:hypothetical protein
MNALTAPMAMGIPARPATWRPEVMLRCEAEDAARLRGISLTRLVDLCVAGILRLAFLDAENRELVLEIARALGAPWSPLDVINRLLTEIRIQIREGRVLSFSSWGQHKQLRLFDSL